jgi:hypothetical protein
VFTVVVIKVQPDGAGDSAGIRNFHTISAVDGLRGSATIEDLQRLLRTKKAGDVVRFTVTDRSTRRECGAYVAAYFFFVCVCLMLLCRVFFSMGEAKKRKKKKKKKLAKFWLATHFLVFINAQVKNPFL